MESEHANPIPEEDEPRQRSPQGLYSPLFEHDACGVGLVARLDNEPDHGIVEKGLEVLRRLMHRGATGNDPETGDGAGILVRLPDAFFRKVVPELPAAGDYAAAMLFGGEGAEKTLEDIAAEEGLPIFAWREVPVDPSAVGPQARSVMPRIRQFFVRRPGRCADSDAFERALFLARRRMEKAEPDAYFCSFSSRTIVYKGLLLAPQAARFYADLRDPDFTSPFALVHQRYSTNTFPSWPLAHPYRGLAHNGEINTLRGNLNALAAREPSLASPLFGADLAKALPLVRPGQSDSASLDNLFELLVAAGRDAPHAMLMLLPQAWGDKYHMGHDVRGFYEYHSALMEPWDGPAAVAFTDGIGAGAALDRNGLRPARWTLTRDGLFVLASETGVLDIPAAQVLRHGRLRPGAMLWLDLPRHRLLEDAELKAHYARRRPYRRWVDENRIAVQGLFTEIVPPPPGDPADLRRAQCTFGYTEEDVELILRPMAETGHEPVGAMGNDAAPAALSRKPRLLYDHFQQLFAQVTNPPIDPIRERLVMSLMTYIGNEGNILAETPEHARLVKFRRPVLTEEELSRLLPLAQRGFPAVTLPMFFSSNLEADIDALCARALDAMKSGAKILILDDGVAVPAGGIPIPALLATAAVNGALAKAGVRPSVGILVRTAEAREVMHLALLLGFGATAVVPYLALRTVAAMMPDNPAKAVANYIEALDAGLLKIMSKMGIATLRSYRSAQIFEAVGLAPDVVKKYFGNIPARVGGVGLDSLAADASTRAAVVEGVLPPGGEYGLRLGGEEHLATPRRIAELRLAVRAGDEARYRAFADSIDDPSQNSVTLRSRLEFAPPPSGPVPLEEVESEDEIVRHFVGGAMSLGSLSPEAHETIAMALNGLGTMSNSGEGGENSERFGTDKNCGIKQVASGRFGVTIDYLRAARDMQIKIAQGAKPGEGGQLPAHKVDAFIGRLRHARPGTTLISPPPHHDIYSIEDLAELIYDLRCSNPAARVSVKLVSEAGVGTVAAGVAKAGADVVLVSGFDGGTGAAPLSSVKHAGLPWELGLAEAQQTLVKNGLRGRVKLQVDGQLRTGRDVVIGALLGAEEFGFGSAMLIALGCVQCRNCNRNCCPVGIATQKPELRAHFAGTPEHLQTYFRFLARDVRAHLAALGLRSLSEAVGRTDLLRPRALRPGEKPLDFSLILHRENAEGSVRFNPSEKRFCPESYDHKNLLRLLRAQPAPTEHSSFRIPHSALENRPLAVRNTDRAVGTELSGEIAATYGAAGLPNELAIDFEGVAGQSFGAFLARGLVFTLRGEANDYVGKGLSGGTIAIRPPTDAAFDPAANAIAGNVVAYGATSGAIYLNGCAGERFGIRNSGATLVAEGIGDHGCEYMTGGLVAVIGPTGVNFAAGMTGGRAYVLDETGDFDLRCNLADVDLAMVSEGSDEEAELRGLLAEHVHRTGSPKAAALLADWTAARPRFVRVEPIRMGGPPISLDRKTECSAITP